MKLWEILVPTVMNEKPVRTKHHREWDKMVRKLSGGLSIIEPIKGQWVDDEGDTIEERMIPVRVVASNTAISRILEFTLNHYNQQAVMCYKISDEAIILSRDDELTW